MECALEVLRVKVPVRIFFKCVGFYVDELLANRVPFMFPNFQRVRRESCRKCNFMYRHSCVCVCMC
jgi:hypothetical protein